MMMTTTMQPLELNHRFPSFLRVSQLGLPNLLDLDHLSQVGPQKQHLLLPRNLLALVHRCLARLQRSPRLLLKSHLAPDLLFLELLPRLLLLPLRSLLAQDHQFQVVLQRLQLQSLQFYPLLQFTPRAPNPQEIGCPRWCTTRSEPL
mmetsp:Transcript_32991/g.50500  ORF Transcript_32991/g.50500 Transcript_32991/m.50500 type:complete len:147 (-) Transcript_32991:1525-1965(-)